MTRSFAIVLLGIALILGSLAFWGVGSSQGALFFGSSAIPLYLGYTAGALIAGAVVASELSKVRF